MNDFDKGIQAQLQDIGAVAKQQAAAQSRVALTGLHEPASNTPGKGIATVFDKGQAIKDIYDRQESCNINFIMLGDFARTVREKRELYDGDKVEFGFYASNLVPEIKGLFTTWKFEETEYGYKYYFSPPIKWDVKFPVEIHCFKKRWAFFDNPDVGFFGVDEYRIPNPFEGYWKVRGIIK